MALFFRSFRYVLAPFCRVGWAKRSVPTQFSARCGYGFSVGTLCFAHATFASNTPQSLTAISMRFSSHLCLNKRMECAVMPVHKLFVLLDYLHQRFDMLNASKTVLTLHKKKESS
jgi:hypothetical protein